MQCIATELKVSVCYYYFADNLTQNLPQLCFIYYWRHPDSLWPLPAVMLRWGDINGHTTHHGAELSGGGASVCICRCSHNIPFEAMTHFLMPKLTQTLFAKCTAPRCEYVGVWLCRPCVIHVCKATTSRGTQHYTSFLSFNFWIFNACVNTGVLPHPMNVCKYAGVFIAASRKQTDTSDLKTNQWLWRFLVSTLNVYIA